MEDFLRHAMELELYLTGDFQQRNNMGKVVFLNRFLLLQWEDEFKRPRQGLTASRKQTSMLQQQSQLAHQISSDTHACLLRCSTWSTCQVKL